MRRRQQGESRIAEEAAEWVATTDPAGPREQAEFLAWLRQSPRHVEEFLLASAIYRELDGVDPDRRQSIEKLLAAASQNVVPLLPALDESARQLDRGRRDKRRGLRWLAAAAALGALVILGAGLWSIFGWKRYSTDIGEQRVFALSDGSIVHLNAHSRIQVRFTHDARTIRMRWGEALFSVAHDPQHPFRVETDGAVIQAVGTQFNVYRRDSGTRVSVIEGAVRIGAAASPQGNPQSTVAAGQETSIAPDGRVAPPAAADTSRAVAWQQRRLEFRDDRLAEVAEEFNRYNRRMQVRVEGAAAGDRRLSGVFDADAPESLIRFLSQADDLAIEDAGTIVIVRERARR